jgi:hypothetical protein
MPQTVRFKAQTVSAPVTEKTFSAGGYGVNRYPLIDFETGDAFSESIYGTRHLVTEDSRQLFWQAGTAEYLDVSGTNSRTFDFNKYLTRPRDRRRHFCYADIILIVNYGSFHYYLSRSAREFILILLQMGRHYPEKAGNS